MRNFRRFLVPVVLLGFTGGHVAWADRSHADFYVEDPYAPHKTDGSTARLGTAVGFVYGEPSDVLALGLTAAAGQRFGRLTIEAEYAYLGFQSLGTYQTDLGTTSGDISLGRGQRLGVIARLEVIRLDSHVMGANTMGALYIEGGAGIAWNHWFMPAPEQSSRLVPDDTKRPEGQAGFGIMLDHRLQEPIGFPHRVAWFLGWRMALAPHEAMTGALCRGVSCRPVPMMDTGGIVDRSMLFQSSLAFTF